MMNVEGRYSVILILKMIKRSDPIFHYSIFLVRYSAVRFKNITTSADAVDLKGNKVTFFEK